MIELQDITKRREAAGLVLDAVSLRIVSGEITALIGANGSGKSTVAKILAGIDEPDEGKVLGVHPTEVGLVPQDYRATLLPWLSIQDNITFPLKIKGFGARTRSHELERMAADLPLSGILTRKAWELSGGQAQLVCIARALIAAPRLLILDEPFSALDIVLSQELGQLLLRIVTARNLAILLITHNIDHAVELANALYLLGSRPGRIIASRRMHTARGEGHHMRQAKLVHEIVQVLGAQRSNAA